VDATGHSHTALRSVLVLPQPYLFSVGANPLTNQCHTVYIDPGATLQVPPRGIAAGGSTSFAIKADGTVAAWGNNSDGQINVPPAATNVVAVGAGEVQDLAVRADGSVVAWGNNSFGQANVPARATNVVAAASGGYQYDLVLRADGTVVAWGENTYGETNVPAKVTNVVAIASGNYHGLALKADGSLVAWGYDGDGETDIPASATNVIAIAANSLFNLALKSDGSVLAWGYGGDGETNISASATNVVAIAAGFYTGYALRADGRVVAWGDNSAGQANVPATVTNVVAIAAGDYHAVAMRADGTVIAWGSSGITNVPSTVYQRPIPFSTSGTVNTNVSGTYFITYTATNNGTVLTNTRTVLVGDKTAPKLSLLGANPMQLIIGTPFVDPGATASNTCAGDLTGSIQVSGIVNTAVPASYTVTYSVTDSTGNNTSSNRIVNVVSAPSLGSFAESVVSNNPVTATVTAQLSATVNPNGLASTAWFQYGLNTSYSASNALALPAVFVSSNLNSLVPALSRSVIYHWRAVASNSLGVTFGVDRTVFAPGLTLAGDLNGDGLVSQSDLNAVLSNYFATSPPLYMTNVTGLGHSNVTFQLSNSPLGEFSLQVSTNLTDWQPLGPAIPVFGFTDTNAPGAPTRYYRLIWP
jgi:alpha-tubulin suppressor-like RCC1 family protein